MLLLYLDSIIICLDQLFVVDKFTTCKTEML